jgi:hypothetical protein
VTVDKISPSSSTTATPAIAPTPRVGTAAVSLNETIYLFSGRGGPSMEALDENGSIWAFTPSKKSWALIKPANSSRLAPDPRSYHAIAADGSNIVYVHAGCPSNGRLSDFWGFNLELREWTQLADAPGPARGGTSLVQVHDRIYRMNGFDGTKELGGSIDVYDMNKNTWSNKSYTADGKDGPSARSVGALLYALVEGKEYLITLFGEADPSSLGHQGAGKMLSDIWAYDLEEEHWIQVEPKDGAERPVARGWFGADQLERNRVLVVGGLDDGNQRLGDAWSLTFE